MIEICVVGMTQTESADALRGFDSGKYNILVSTSKAEEGLDIQACNISIRYMYIKDVTAKIQTAGTQMINFLSIFLAFSIVSYSQVQSLIFLLFL